MSIEQLEKLGILKEKGVISDNEFEIAKKDILENIHKENLSQNQKNPNRISHKKISGIGILGLMFGIYIFVEYIFPESIICQENLSAQACECFQYTVSQKINFFDKIRILIFGTSAQELAATLNVIDSLRCSMQ